MNRYSGSTKYLHVIFGFICLISCFDPFVWTAEDSMSSPSSKYFIKHSRINSVIYLCETVEKLILPEVCHQPDYCSVFCGLFDAVLEAIEDGSLSSFLPFIHLVPIKYQKSSSCYIFPLIAEDYICIGDINDILLESPKDHHGRQALRAFAALKSFHLTLPKVQEVMEWAIFVLQTSDCQYLGSLHNLAKLAKSFLYAPVDCFKSSSLLSRIPYSEDLCLLEIYFLILSFCVSHHDFIYTQLQRLKVNTVEFVEHAYDNLCKPGKALPGLSRQLFDDQLPAIAAFMNNFSFPSALPCVRLVKDCIGPAQLIDPLVALADLAIEKSHGLLSSKYFKMRHSFFSRIFLNALAISADVLLPKSTFLASFRLSLESSALLPVDVLQEYLTSYGDMFYGHYERVFYISMAWKVGNTGAVVGKTLKLFDLLFVQYIELQAPRVIVAHLMPPVMALLQDTFKIAEDYCGHFQKGVISALTSSFDKNKLFNSSATSNLYSNGRCHALRLLRSFLAFLQHIQAREYQLLYRSMGLREFVAPSSIGAHTYGWPKLPSVGPTHEVRELLFFLADFVGQAQTSMFLARAKEINFLEFCTADPFVPFFDQFLQFNRKSCKDPHADKTFWTNFLNLEDLRQTLLSSKGTTRDNLFWKFPKSNCPITRSLDLRKIVQSSSTRVNSDGKNKLILDKCCRLAKPQKRSILPVAPPLCPETRQLQQRTNLMSSFVNCIFLEDLCPKNLAEFSKDEAALVASMTRQAEFLKSLLRSLSS